MIVGFGLLPGTADDITGQVVKAGVSKMFEVPPYCESGKDASSASSLTNGSNDVTFGVQNFIRFCTSSRFAPETILGILSG